MRLVLGARRRRLVCSCLVLAAIGGRAARSPPSRASADDGTLTDVQQAFIDEGAVQCGFCTPGLVMAVHDLLDARPEPDRSRARGAVGQPLPLHRLRPHPRRGRDARSAIGPQVTARRDRHTRSQRPRSGLRSGGPRHQPDPTRRHPEGAGSLRVLVRPLGRRDGVGPHPAIAASARAHSLASTSAPRGASPASRSSSRPPTFRARRYGLDHRGPAGVRLRHRPLRRTAGRRCRRRPSRDGAARRARRSSSSTRCSSR